MFIDVLLLLICALIGVKSICFAFSGGVTFVAGAFSSEKIHMIVGAACVLLGIGGLAVSSHYGAIYLYKIMEAVG